MSENKPSMNWQVPDLEREWKRFKQHCEFTFKGPLSSKTEIEKVNYLMTFIGDKGREIYETFTWAPETSKTPAENDTLAGVYAKYGAYVAPKKNEIRATVNFHRRRQEDGEKFDNFVTDLRVLVKGCRYNEEERMIRDAIVLRSLHQQVQERCLEYGDELTLDIAVNIGRNHEAAQDSLKVIEAGAGGGEEVHTVSRSVRENNYRGRSYRGQRRRGQKSKQRPQGDQFARPNKGAAPNKYCGQCGKDKSHERCAAVGKECYFCHSFGHFAIVCRKRLHANIVEDMCSNCSGDESDNSYEYQHCIDMIGVIQEANGSEWWEEVSVKGETLRVQIDTGAAQSLIPFKLFKRMNCQVPIVPSDRKFQSYTRHPIQVEGQVKLPTRYKDKCVDVLYYIVHVDQKPLLSGEVSKQLGLIERIHVTDEIDKYPELKTTTGMLPGTYTLKIDPTVKPVVHGPRRQPKALADKVVEKLKEMEKEGHIITVTEPTDWVSSMVTVVKNGKIRIVSDPKDLNKAIRREHYPIPTVEEVVASLAGTTVFSVIDAKAGFMQIKLDYESSLLTTFNTPIGRFRWLRLPFGIKSAPEIYQRIMDTMLEGIEGAKAIMDDILVAGKSPEDHDRIMKEVVTRATKWNLKLNFEKCQIKKPQVKYVGHVVTQNGLEPDWEKVRAVRQMPVPKNKEDIRRFLGFIQYLAKFIPNLSAVNAPLRELMKTDVEFHWDKPQQESWDRLKEMCSSAPVLAYYDVNKEVTIQCDASSYALGAVLLQEGRPVAYTSRALTQSEQNYAQIEKETLAIVHACKKFHYYIFGRKVTVQSDHKPLQAIYSKSLQSAPMRLQGMMLNLQAYDLHVTYVPGTDIAIGDALSRANLPESEPDMEPVAVNMVDFIAVSPARYLQFQQCTANELSELYSMVGKGWPDRKRDIPHSVRPYWAFRDELAVTDGIIFKGMRIIVPPSMRAEMLSHIHSSHLGITKCKQRAREALFWPGMSKQIESLVKDCVACNTYQNQQSSEPLCPTRTPDLPWIEVASDIFEFEGGSWLVTVDYYSKFIEVDKLKGLSSAHVIDVLKSQLCRHGIPEKLRTDNGPQFVSQQFSSFCKDYGIEHDTSSPHYPQSNGLAERAVQTVKRLWSKGGDKYLSLLDHRTTPLKSCGLSPSQLCMNRRLRSKLPLARELLKPQQLDAEAVRRSLDEDKEKQRQYYNKRAGDCLPKLKPGDPVRMLPFPGSKRWLPAKVVSYHKSPRSFVVEYNGKMYRRNRKHLRLSTNTAHMRCAVSSSKPPATLPTPDTLGKPETSLTPKFQKQGYPSDAPPAVALERNSRPTQELAQQLRPTQEPAQQLPDVPEDVAAPEAGLRRSNRVRKKPERLDL
jgi:transposase InsO family protein